MRSPFCLCPPLTTFDPIGTFHEILHGGCGIEGDAILLIPELQPFQNGDVRTSEVDANTSVNVITLRIKLETMKTATFSSDS
jgi:hypothetical protein